MFDNSFIPHSLTFEMMSDEDIHDLEFSIFQFKRHDVIESEHAMLLFKMDILQLSPVTKFKFGEKTAEYCCVRFTNKGRKSVKELMRIAGLSEKKFETLPDSFEDHVANSDFTWKFVMHDRRLRKELEASPKRAKAVIQRYAIGFEKELEPQPRSQPPFIFEA